ncbi:MAG TPA: hypothetical protein VK742_20415 [Candidatus Sulfotelmatobacter sp.]|jgi:hypothetical protein|nr:hypothetical protein [Candidatus Sulfotelmatobacter sp.]
MKSFTLLLLAADPAAGNGPAKTPPAKTPTIEELQAQLDAANAKLADASAADAARIEVEKAIAEKTSKGLTREQAIAVIRRQKEHDEAQEAFWAKRRPAVIAILKKYDDTVEQRKKLNTTLNTNISPEEIAAAQKAMTASK